MPYAISEYIPIAQLSPPCSGPAVFHFETCEPPGGFHEEYQRMEGSLQSGRVGWFQSRFLQSCNSTEQEHSKKEIGVGREKFQANWNQQEHIAAADRQTTPIETLSIEESKRIFQKIVAGIQ